MIDAMDEIPLPPSSIEAKAPPSPKGPSSEGPPVTESPEETPSPAPTEKVPVLSKEKAKKRLLAFGKGISFGLKARVISKEKPITSYETEDSTPTHPIAPPVKKLNIDAIMEEEKEMALAASRPTYVVPSVMPAVPQLIVPVLPPNAVVPSLMTKKQASPPARREVAKKKHRSESKYSDIVDIPSGWTSFKTLGLQLPDPQFSKFKRRLDKEHKRLDAIEALKRRHLNIVKKGSEISWLKYMSDPVASEAELAFRGLDFKAVVNKYSKEKLQDLLWRLDPGYHSMEFPKEVNKKATKGRAHSVSYCYHPRFYPRRYETREEVVFDEGGDFHEVLEALFSKDGDSSSSSLRGFSSSSFVQKEEEEEGPSNNPHRPWFQRNFMNDRETVFTCVAKAREAKGFLASVPLSWSLIMSETGEEEEDSGAKEEGEIGEEEEEPMESTEREPSPKRNKTSGPKKKKKKKERKGRDPGAEVLAAEGEKPKKSKKQKKAMNKEAIEKDESKSSSAPKKKKKKKNKSLKKDSKPKKSSKKSKNKVHDKKPEEDSKRSEPSAALSVKDPRTRSLFAVAGYGFEEEDEGKSGKPGPRTPQSSSSRGGPRTPSPKSHWRPPSPGQSPGHYSSHHHREGRKRRYERRISGGSSEEEEQEESRSYRRRNSRSPRSRRSSNYSPSYSTYHCEQSLADSTISDADLLGYASGNLRYQPYEEFSPKRISLDERLEKELGVPNDGSVPPPPAPPPPPPPPIPNPLNPPQDFSVPPPGYPLRRIQPQQQQQPYQHLPPLMPNLLPHPSAPPSRTPPVVLTPLVEEGRLVRRVGNMLQILPEGGESSNPSPAAPALMVPPPQTPPPPPPSTKAVPAATAAPPSSKDPTPHTAASLMRKMEELKRQRDLKKKAQEEEAALEKSSEQPETQQQQIKEEEEAKILQEAISSVPEMDEEMDVAPQEDEEEEQNEKDSSSSGKTSSKKPPPERIHYISLKPFSKKERKRLQRAPLDESSNNNEEEEPWVPRSPVPLPDASTIKPILLQLGFSGRDKKVLRYADGILPGQGSPDINDLDSSTVNSSSEQSSSSAPKKRKKVRLRILSSQKAGGGSSVEDSPPPPPPSGSPPLHHYSTWLSWQNTTPLTS